VTLVKLSPVEIMAKGLLIKTGYLGKDEARPEVIHAAYEQYMKEHPIKRPLYPNDLGEESDCTICRDRQWLYPIGADGRTDYSKVVPCECTKESTQSNWIKKELARAGIPDTCAHAYTFDTFQLLLGTENSFKAAKAFDIMLREGAGATGAASYMILMLYGACGAGKSHLLYATYRSAILAGLKAEFMVWPDLTSKAGQPKLNEGSFESVFQPAKDCDILFLDEVKFTDRSGKVIAWMCDKFEDIINYRFRCLLPMMITTNHAKSEFPPAVISRFSDSTICKLVHNSGEDYRKMKKQRRSA
jgi:DNA replication protein DnaC